MFQGKIDPGLAIAGLENGPIIAQEQTRGRTPAFSVILD
jgi:hypothetical protein